MASADWTKPLIQMRNPPRQAILLADDGTTNRRRVFVGPNTMVDPERRNGTTWLTNDDGFCRCDGLPSEYDIANGEVRS